MDVSVFRLKMYLYLKNFKIFLEMEQKSQTILLEEFQTLDKLKRNLV